MGIHNNVGRIDTGELRLCKECTRDMVGKQAHVLCTRLEKEIDRRTCRKMKKERLAEEQLKRENAGKYRRIEEADR